MTLFLPEQAGDIPQGVDLQQARCLRALGAAPCVFPVGKGVFDAAMDDQDGGGAVI